MKKLIFLLFGFLFFSTLCFAQQAQVPAESKVFTGKVDSITIGDVAKGAKSELMVVADNGLKLNFIVDGTQITDKDAKAVALSDIKKNSKVAITYTMSEIGAHKTQSIKLVE